MGSAGLAGQARLRGGGGLRDGVVVRRLELAGFAWTWKVQREGPAPNGTPVRRRFARVGADSWRHDYLANGHGTLQAPRSDMKRARMVQRVERQHLQTPNSTMSLFY